MLVEQGEGNGSTDNIAPYLAYLQRIAASLRLQARRHRLSLRGQTMVVSPDGLHLGSALRQSCSDMMAASRNSQLQSH